MVQSVDARRTFFCFGGGWSKGEGIYRVYEFTDGVIRQHHLPDHPMDEMFFGGFDAFQRGPVFDNPQSDRVNVAVTPGADNSSGVNRWASAVVRDFIRFARHFIPPAAFNTRQGRRV